MITRPEFYLPPNPTLMTVFNRVDKISYRNVRLPADTQVVDYLKAAVAYLHYQDQPDLLQDAAKALWRYIHHPMLEMVVTDAPKESALKRNWPVGSIHGLNGNSLQPAVLFTEFEPTMMPYAHRPLYVHPEFATEGQLNPIETVAAVANTASRVRDWENGTLKRADQVLKRAEMMEAQVLIAGIKEDPTLTLSPRAEELIAIKYPRGLDSYSQSVDF